jgi:hypothetical protein
MMDEKMIARIKAENEKLNQAQTRYQRCGDVPTQIKINLASELGVCQGRLQTLVELAIEAGQDPFKMWSLIE